MNDLRKFLRDWVKVAVLGGFERQTDLLRDVAARVDDEGGSKSLITELRTYARALYAKQRVVEQKWKKGTTNDAIDAAFDALNAAGIVALQSAGYTTSDGWEDCNGEASELRDAGKTPRGATFYHGQDLERGVAGEGLWLAFGAYEKNKKKHDASSVAIGRDVVQTLERFGVKMRWNGSVDKRIEIRPFKWQRRQFTKVPKK